MLTFILGWGSYRQPFSSTELLIILPCLCDRSWRLSSTLKGNSLLKIAYTFGEIQLLSRNIHPKSLKIVLSPKDPLHFFESVKFPLWNRPANYLVTRYYYIMHWTVIGSSTNVCGSWLANRQAARLLPCCSYLHDHVSPFESKGTWAIEKGQRENIPCLLILAPWN